jgi:hypothetical protein
VPLRADKGSISRYGRLIVNIANSLDSEHAIHSYFEGIKSIFNFSPHFFAEVSNLYPSLAKAHALLTPNDLDLISYITRESKLLSGLNGQFENIGYVLEDYDPDNNSLLLNTFEYIYQDETSDGRSDFTAKLEGPHFVNVLDLQDEIASLRDPAIIYQHISELMEIGSTIKKLKENASGFVKKAPKAAAQRYEEIKNLHKKIDEIKLIYISILDSIIENKNLSEIPAFLTRFQHF